MQKAVLFYALRCFRAITLFFVYAGIFGFKRKQFLDRISFIINFKTLNFNKKTQ